MSKVPGVMEPESVPVSLVRTQLDRMLSSQTFVRSERLSAFLRFVVEEAVEGRCDALKENLIAAELYGKHLGFRTRE